MQDFATRIVTKSRKCDHITPILKQLKWIPVKDTLYLREAVMTFKSIKNLASNQLHLKVMSCQLTKRHYKLRNDEDLRPPRYKTTTGQRSFIYRACRIWNFIGETSRQCANVAIFKNKLKSKLVESVIST